jgi:hypothetical protein
MHDSNGNQINDGSIVDALETVKARRLRDT